MRYLSLNGVPPFFAPGGRRLSRVESYHTSRVLPFSSITTAEVMKVTASVATAVALLVPAQAFVVSSSSFVGAQQRSAPRSSSRPLQVRWTPVCLFTPLALARCYPDRDQRGSRHATETAGDPVLCVVWSGKEERALFPCSCSREEL